MTVNTLNDRAATVARALITALEKLDSLPRRVTDDLHLAAEGMGYAGVLIMAADLAADHRPDVSQDTLTELRKIAKESHDHELLEDYELLVTPQAA